MAKTNLKPSSGLPLFFNGEDIQSEEYAPKEISVVGIEDIRPQLLNQDLDCPEVFYSKYKDLDNSQGEIKGNNLRMNIYLMKPNLAGIEFTKSKATRCSKYPRLFEIVYGGGSILLQKYISPIENKFYRLQVKKGSKILVPPNYSICLVNTRQTSTVIALEISSRDANTRVVLEEKRGMSYYIIRKNAKVEIVRNPSYKIVHDVGKIDMDSILKDHGITEKTPIIKQILRNNEKFNWLFKESDMDF
jgi:glucose-6-phosphate isomerase